MKILVGLGNPGGEYVNTRHNVGFMLLDRLVTSGWMKSKNGLLAYSWLKSDLELVKPQTFMNKSGEAVSYVLKKHKVKPLDLIVVHDDLDIALGMYKIQLGKGPKIHNGVNSVTTTLETDQFWRVRIGIEKRSLDTHKIPGRSYVLNTFLDDEMTVLDEVFGKITVELKERFFQ
jgi:peptidyl-tRNA hydrolase, PTH1 family